MFIYQNKLTSNFFILILNKPPKSIPRILLSDYTMDNRIPIKYFYLDNSQQDLKPKIYTKSMIDDHIEKVSKNNTFHYGNTDRWLYKALNKFPVKEKNVLVIGSVRPVYESIIITYKGEPTTVDYNPIISYDDRITIIPLEVFINHSTRYDAAFSISSFEHDGLGRYGDPLNPNADILAMENMKKVLKPNGLLYLSVPIGQDTLVWNAHRIYGPIRLPLLLSGWEFVGFFPSLFPFLNPKLRDGIQPIFVLRNRNPDDNKLEIFFNNLFKSLKYKRPFVAPLRYIKKYCSFF